MFNKNRLLFLFSVLSVRRRSGDVLPQRFRKADTCNAQEKLRPKQAESKNIFESSLGLEKALQSKKIYANISRI